jgi:formate hydrogenlyase transcriptional activator
MPMPVKMTRGISGENRKESAALTDAAPKSWRWVWSPIDADILDGRRVARYLVIISPGIRMSSVKAFFGNHSAIAGVHVADQNRSAPDKVDSECDFQALCDRSMAGMYVIIDGCFQYANRALAELLGRQIEELIGASLLSFVLPDDRARVELQMRRRLEGRAETSRFEVRHMRADGTVVHVEVLGSRLQHGGRPALMGTIVDFTARKQAESATEDRARFERLLAELSASFVNLTADQIDENIDGSLKLLAEFLGNDRSTLVEFDDDQDHVTVTHSYSVAGCEGFPVGVLPVARFPWFVGQSRRGATIFLKDLPEELPSEATQEREYCRTHGIKSNVTVPLAVGGTVLGGLTFAFMRRRCDWPAEILLRLQSIGEVFANALMRERNQESLRVALDENRRLRQQLEDENSFLREQVFLKHPHGRIIGRSDVITRVLAAAERVAPTDAPVLLTGETGTGKELLSHRIHELSERRGRPMVTVNCASLPATLVESELFGREAGAYTGAASAQVGRFAVADRSTLFLDEIGEFPIELQAKLLRVLENGQFERLGSPKTIKVDVRIIAATNRDLGRAVREGTFRADLYHRLSVFPILLPPLRERREDIPQLVWTFVETFGRRMGKPIKCIPHKSMQRLQQYSWPGNVRELSNVVERAMILTSNDILHFDVPADTQGVQAERMSLKEREREQILRVLMETGWRIRGAGGAAEILDIKPTTLEARMAKAGIQRPKQDSSIS